MHQHTSRRIEILQRDGMGFCGWMFVVFFALKVAGLANDWSWWWLLLFAIIAILTGEGIKNEWRERDGNKQAESSFPRDKNGVAIYPGCRLTDKFGPPETVKGLVKYGDSWRVYWTPDDFTTMSERELKNVEVVQ